MAQTEKRRCVALVPYSYDSVRYEVGQIVLVDEARFPFAVAAGQVEEFSLPDSGEEVPEGASSPQELLESLGSQWDSELTPEAYLEQFPDGPDAALAQRLVEVKARIESGT